MGKPERANTDRPGYHPELVVREAAIGFQNEVYEAAAESITVASRFLTRSLHDMNGNREILISGHLPRQCFLNHNFKR